MTKEMIQRTCRQGQNGKQQRNMRSLECTQFHISSRPDYININRKGEKTNTTAKVRENIITSIFEMRREKEKVSLEPMSSMKQTGKIENENVNKALEQIV